MKIAIIVCCLLSILASNSDAQEINWESKLERATAIAAEQDKLVLLHFTADWCRPCQQLETFVFSNSMVQAAMAEQIIPMKVDVDLMPELAKEFGVTAVPFDVAMTPDGRLLLTRRSPLESFAYAKMISSLSKLRNGSAGEETASIRRDLLELQNKMKPESNRLVDRGFTPQTPTHSMPGVSSESMELMQKSSHYDQVAVVKNPFFDPNRPRMEAQVADSNDSGFASVPDASKNSLSNSKGQDLEVADNRPPARVLNPMFNESTSAEPSGQVADNSFAPAKATPPRIANNASSKGYVLGPVLNDPDATNLASESSKPLEVENNPKNIVPDRNQVAQADPGIIAPLNNEIEEQTLAPIPPSKPIVFALQGKCPVTLALETKWDDGNEDFGCVHRGRTYLFASEAKLKLFQQDPDKFSPLLAGYDPVAFHESGELADGLEEFGVFMGQQGEQKIVLFQNEANRDKFKSNPRQFLETVRVAMNQADVSTIR